MSINEKIEQALSGITENIWPLCCPSDRSPDLYIVYNPELESAGTFADDEDQDWVINMQVHLFTKGNYHSLKKTIKDRLKRAGFMVTGIETMSGKDSGYYHLIFLCYIEEE